ncbi:MAG TPA: hypothetical protein V6D20_21840 [Candidatus Obscuribacterales bacterium]
MSSERTTAERLVVLETDANNIQSDLDEIKADVKEIKAGLNRQKGFIAGIMFVITPLWATIVVFAKSFWDRYLQ